MTTANRHLPLAGAYLHTAYDWLVAKGRLPIAATAFIGGLLLSRTFSPVSLFPLIFIITPIWLTAIEKARNTGEIFSFGWWTGFGLFAVGLNWIGHSFTQQQAVPEILAPFAIFGLAAMLSLYVAGTFWLLWRLRVQGIFRSLIFAAVWTLMEIARGHLFSGFPWHIVGSMWADWLPVAQNAYYITVYGLSFVTMFVAASLYDLLTGDFLTRICTPVLSAVVVAAGLWTGYDRLDNETLYHTNISLRLVQANVKQREKWLSYLIEDHFSNHLQLSRSGSASGRAEGVKLLIWPETAVPWQDFDQDGSIPRWRVSKLLDRGSFMITGSPRYQQNGDDYNYYNSLFALNRAGDIFATYDKKHLVPFGEYLPFSGLLRALGLEQLTGGASFSKGPGNRTIELPGLPAFSPLICYEIIFPGNVTPAGGKRPEWLLNITNDGWFGLTEGPRQHLALARFRAIEEGLPLVRNAGGGVSAVIDPYGRSVSELDLNTKGVLDAVLPQKVAPPPVAPRTVVLGITILCALLTLSAIIIAWKSNPARRNAAPDIEL